MCGICGWVGCSDWRGAEDVPCMVEALRPRGPDACGIWRSASRPALLGHTRLSIIDPAGSQQPMTNEDGSIVVTFNGEIYNFTELRRDLLARGHQFRSRGDTEVLVHLYEEFGPELVRHLDGMYAFAIYDERRHRCCLARDRVGIKPLYYCCSTDMGDLVFASDLPSLLRHRAVPRMLHLPALAQFFSLGYTVAPDAWIAGVRQLEPGETVLWDRGRLARTSHYSWRYDPAAELRDPQRALDELGARLADSVAEQLVADVPVGSFLSGGLDSTVVSAYAQRAGRRGGPLRTFTVRFWEPGFDEAERARSVAKELGTQHEEIAALDLLDDADALDAVVRGLGEPFGDSSAMAVHALCRAARPHVKVALSGDGGDELFLGYSGLRLQHYARHLRLLPAQSRALLARITAGAETTVVRRLDKYLRLSLRDDASLILESSRRWPWGELAGLMKPEVLALVFPCPDEPLPEVTARLRDGGPRSLGELQLRFHLLIDLPGDCLLKVDRMSMAHGLEVRVPMLSNAMLDYAARLPVSVRGVERQAKEPLRTLAGALAATLRTPSPKLGFSVPLVSWLQRHLGRYWREHELARGLAACGLEGVAADRMLARFEALAPNGDRYRAGWLATRLYDLAVLGRWAMAYGVYA